MGLGARGYVNQAVIKREGSCKQRGSDLEKGCLWVEWDPGSGWELSKAAELEALHLNSR